MTIVDDAIALIKQWEKTEMSVMYSSPGSSAGGEGTANVTFDAGQVTLVSAIAAYPVDESSVQSVRTGVITLKSDGGVVELFVLD